MMKSFIALGVFALIVLCSSAPVVEQQAEAEARLDIYNDFLAGLFSNLVQTTVGSVANLLNQLITENPLGVGKRSADDDLAARVDAWSFLYDNILQQFFSGLVNNAFGTISSTLTNLIETNPLGVGKRSADDDLAARVDAWSFLYDNILQQFFSGLVNNAFGTISSTLTNLIETNPLGVGKRALNVNIFQFLNQNIFADLFGDLVSNTADYLQNALNNVLNKPFGNIGKRSVDIQQAQALVAQTISTLVAKFRVFAHQAIASLADRQKLTQLVQENLAYVKATVANLAQQLSQIIPAALNAEVSQVLAALQSVLVFWTSGLGGSLGPVIGPFLP